jgi:sulfide:quinone oxidoreductase
MHHRIVVVGGGTAGITVAARLRRAGERDIALVEPAEVHYYQPFWTLVGAGIVGIDKSRRPEASVVPRGVHWIHEAVAEFDPDRRVLSTRAGTRLGYDVLVCCPGLELAWDLVPGLADAMATPYASSNYTVDLAPKNAELAAGFAGGTALFAMPGTPIKCKGAPQKAAYLACDAWRRRGVLARSQVTFATGADALFSVPEFAVVLEGVAARYGIATRLSTELVEVDPGARSATLTTSGPAGTTTETLTYDLLHAAPPQRAPGFVRDSPLAGPGPFGWVPVDKHSLRHVTYPEVFALGDVSDAPTSKTGAAARAQAAVVAAGVLAVLGHREPTARYEGYTACPIVTARHRMVLAECDYDHKAHPTIPFIDTRRERYDMWLLKRYGLPALYWNVVLRGRG